MHRLRSIHCSIARPEILLLEASGAYNPAVRIRDPQSALALLERLGAPRRVLVHHALVVEAAAALLEGLSRFDAHFDGALVLVGAALHDVGKILHPAEMDGPGHEHEEAGRALLEAQGLGPLARFAVSHARWDAPELPLEDQLVALADKLWKGKRVEALERVVVERLAERTGEDFWAVFVEADAVFETVATGADDRLARSVG